MTDTLALLEKWYSLQCNGHWEHQHGVKIDTLDNPGWRMQIELRGTELANRSIDETFEERTANDWIFFKVEDDVFTAAGGPQNLRELIEVFLSWARTYGPPVDDPE